MKTFIKTGIIPSMVMLISILLSFPVQALDTCHALFGNDHPSLEIAKNMIEASQTKRGMERNKLFVEEPHYIRIRVGMPPTLKLISSEGKVFRHYTSKEGLQEILKTKGLRAGWTPFYYSGYITDYNEDLTGIFITTPEVGPDTIGVRPENSVFVDFRFLENTGILYLRDGILLVPGPPSIELWKLHLYQSERREYYQDYAEEFAKWDMQGIPEPLTVPIEVIDYSR